MASAVVVAAVVDTAAAVVVAAAVVDTAAVVAAAVVVDTAAVVVVAAAVRSGSAMIVVKAASKAAVKNAGKFHPKIPGGTRQTGSAFFVPSSFQDGISWVVKNTDLPMLEGRRTVAALIVA